MRLALVLPLSARQRARLVAAGLEVADTPAAGFCPGAFRTARIAFGNPPAEWLAGSAVEWLQLESAGFGEYAGRDIGRVTVTNLAGLFAGPVAESILAGLLALVRGIDRLVLLRASGGWTGDGLRPSLACLAGARAVLFGRGAINGRVADLLAPFGCHVARFGRGWDPAELDAALAEADILVAAAPDTPETRDTFDARRLARLRPHALLASFGRGTVLDEAALAAALAAGRLGGAVIDVTREEPLPPGHPFWTVPNLILTQHTGGGTRDETDRKVDFFLDNLARFRSGARLRGVVDFDRGY